MIYTLIVYLIYLAFTKYIPMLIHQTFDMIQSVIDFYEHQPKDAGSRFYNTSMISIERTHFSTASKMVVNTLTIYKISENWPWRWLCVHLKFLFMIEKQKTILFSRLFLKSEFSWFFQDAIYFGVRL